MRGVEGKLNIALIKDVVAGNFIHFRFEGAFLERFKANRSLHAIRMVTRLICLQKESKTTTS